MASQSIADIIRGGQTSGEFPPTRGRGRARAASSAPLIDGLAIQVIMNDTEVSPERMHDTCRRVASRLIGAEI